MQRLYSESRHLERPHLSQEQLGSCSTRSAEISGDDFEEGRVLPHRPWFAVILPNMPGLCRKYGKPTVHIYLNCILDHFLLSSAIENCSAYKIALK